MAETDDQRTARIAREDATWTGPRFVALLFSTLFCALVFIYVIAAYPTKSRPFWDFAWYPFGVTPSAKDLETSSGSGLTR